MIKHCFGISPADMDDDEWSQNVAEAIWVMQFKAQLIAAEVSKVFAGEK